ncbi:hypothetical protein ACIGXM_14590 [Kitasatospora sp. NPDC052896]|uniref:hypothetical protein n=1 Tax=Kitasatospora sp. NPDC052896 TaxID=3364061 RepID=UPI0037C58D9A
MARGQLYVERVWTVEVDAYNSRASWGGAWFVYACSGWDETDAINRIPRSHAAPEGVRVRARGGECRHAQPCFANHDPRPHFPEWRIAETRVMTRMRWERPGIKPYGRGWKKWQRPYGAELLDSGWNGKDGWS